MKHIISIISIGILIGCNSDEAKMRNLIEERDKLQREHSFESVKDEEKLDNILDSIHSLDQMYQDSFYYYLDKNNKVKYEYFQDLRLNLPDPRITEAKFRIDKCDSNSANLKIRLDAIIKEIEDLKLINSTK